MGKEEDLYGFLGTQSSGNQTWNCLLGFSSKIGNFCFVNPWAAKTVLKNIGAQDI